MQIERSERRNTGSSEIQLRKLTIGQPVRVSILKKTGSYSLVSLNGKRLVADLRGNPPEKTFIGKIVKLKPRIIIKYIRGIEDSNSLNRFFDGNLDPKKSIIRNLFKTDNLFVDVLYKEFRRRQELKVKIKKSLRETSIQSLLSLKGIDDKVLEFLILQNIFNFVSEKIIHLLIPLKVDENKLLLRGMIVGDDEDGYSLFISIHFEGDESSTGLLINVDFSSISCTIFTSDEGFYKKLDERKKCLENSFRSIKYDRVVRVEVRNDFSELEGLAKKIRKIDLKM